MKTILLIIPLLFIMSNTLHAQIPENSKNLSIRELDSLTWTYFSQRKLDQAEKMAVRAVELSAEQYGKEDSTYAYYLGNYGIFLGQLQRFDEAVAALLEALPIQEKALGKAHYKYSTIATTLANMYTNMRRYDEALALQKELLILQEKSLGINHPTYAATVYTMAIAYYYKGDYDASEKAYLEAIRSYGAQNTKDISYGSALSSLSALYKSMGRYDEAELLCLEAKTLYEDLVGREHYYYASNLVNLAAVYRQMGQYKEAEAFYLEAKVSLSASLGETHSSYLTCLNNLATTLASQEKYEEARLNLMEVLRIRASIQTKDHPEYLYSFKNLGTLYEKMGNKEKALEILLEVRDRQLKVIGEAHPDYAATLLFLGVVYYQMNDYEKAKEIFHTTERIQAEALHAEHPDYIATLLELARIYRKSGDPQKGMDYTQKALCLSTGYPIDSFQITKSGLERMGYFNYNDRNNGIKSIESLGAILKARGDYELSYVALRAAIRYSERIRSSFLSEENKLLSLKSNLDLIDIGIEDAIRLHNMKINPKHNYLIDAFQLAETNKSVSLQAAMKAQSSKTLGNLPDSLFLQEKSIQKELAQLNKQLHHHEQGDPKKGLLQAQINELNLQSTRFQENLKKNYSKYYELKYATSDIFLEDIQRELAPKTAMIEYFIRDSINYLFYIDKHKIEYHRLEIDRTTIESEVKKLRSALTDYRLLSKKPELSYQRFNQSSNWLYENCLAMGLKSATDIEHLIVVPDGALSYVPFEVLLVEKGSPNDSDYRKLHYLINDYSFSYNYSAGLWKENKTNQGKGKATKNLLACASDYSTPDSLILGKRAHLLIKIRRGLSPLPSAKEEVQLLSENYEGDFLQNDSTNEAYFKQIAGDYKVIHLAMHGVLNQHYPILSSLAFTEDGNTEEDNFLQAYEISHLDLNAELVVLSACETGAGKFEQGEGVLSLARAFMFAGVPSLVVSLWQVNDYSTAVIMQDFYEELANGTDKAVALRKAKLRFISGSEGIMAHPAFWSAFIQLGDSKPVSLVSKGTWTPWLIGGVLLLVLGLGLLIKRKQIA